MVVGKLTQPFDEREVASVEKFAVVLRKDGDVDRLAPAHRPRVRFRLARQDIEEHRDRRALFADETDLLVLLHDEGEVLEKSLLRQPFDRKDVVADLPFEFEVDERVFAERRFDVVDREPLELLFAGSRLAGFGGVRRKAGDKLLQLFCPLFRLLVLVALLAGDELARLIPEIVVTEEELDLAEIHITDIGTDFIKKMAVVRNDDDRVFKIQQIIFQPAHRFKVEVVGRLVEEQHVGIPEQRLCKQNLDLHFRIQLTHAHAVIFGGNIQCVEQRLCLALRLPAVQLGKLALEL